MLPLFDRPLRRDPLLTAAFAVLLTATACSLPGNVQLGGSFSPTRFLNVATVALVAALILALLVLLLALLRRGHRQPARSGAGNVPTYRATPTTRPAAGSFAGGSSTAGATFAGRDHSYAGVSAITKFPRSEEVSIT